MRRRLATVVMLGAMLPAGADEAWRQLYVDAAVSVSIDASSLSRREQTWVFRERELLHAPALDQASMRRIREIRYLRQADCAANRLSTLSLAVFSEHGVMVHYEARQPEAALWDAPRSSREVRLLEAVCGPA
jgi:hypothetical protein